MEGKDLCTYLLKAGAQVTIFDKKNEEDLDFVGIDKAKVNLICGKNYLKDGIKGFDVVFRSPGVYRYLPEIVKAQKAGVKISSAIKLFFELCPAKIIGVTGTKGKGTTSTLIYQILKSARRDVYLAGNIGKPYLELLSVIRHMSYVILELSSFQLIDMDKSPHVAVVLNITSDHLDWHKDIDEYINAKKNIVRYQSVSDWAVINEEYETPKSFAQLTKGKVVFFSKSAPTNSAFVENGEIVFLQNGERIVLGKSHWLKLRGEHNLENVTAALSVASVLGIEEKIVKKIVFSFRGLEHRLELVGNVGGVSFYNDSFATGPQPTIAAIKSFDELETLILGGSDKDLDYKDLGVEIAKRKNVENIILIGQVRDLIEKALQGASFKGQVYDLKTSRMSEIVKKAFEITPKGGVVLLSPAAASFDMFKSYKDRGEQFKKSVKELVYGQKADRCF